LNGGAGVYLTTLLAAVTARLVGFGVGAFTHIFTHEVFWMAHPMLINSLPAACPVCALPQWIDKEVPEVNGFGCFFGLNTVIHGVLIVMK